MSNFKDLFRQECDEFVIEEPTRPFVCPTCIPNIAAPKINWLQTDEPYFDERTCEYIYNYTSPLLVNQLDGKTIAEHLEMVKPYAASDMFEYFNKRPPKNFKIHFNNPGDIAFIKVSEKDVNIDPSNQIKIRVAIDAIYFDKLEDRVVPLNENPPEESADFPNEILIVDQEADFALDFETVLLGLTGYEFRQALFTIERGAFLREDDEEKFVIFKFKNLKDNLKQFRKQVDRLLELNGYRILSVFNFFSFDPVVTKLRITLDNSDESSPLKIDKVFIEFENCPEIELLKGIDNFRKKANFKDAIYLMANFEQVLADLTADPTKDWLEFTEQYVYPPVFVDYGDNPENTQIVDSGLKCASIDFDEILKNILNDLIIDPWDLLSAEFDKQSCNPDLKKSNPTVKQFYNPKAQQEFVKAYERRLRQLKEENKPRLREFEELPERGENETEQEFQERVATLKEQREQFLKSLENEAQEQAYKQVKQDEIDNPEKYSFDKLLEEEYERQKKKKDKKENSAFEIFKVIEKESATLLEGDLFKKFTDTVGLCGINEGTKIALDCLLKQVTFDDAMKAAVNIAFEYLPPSGLEEILLFGLNPLKQEELKTLVANKLGRNSAGEVAWPWELPINNKQAQKNQALGQSIQKQYIVDLRADVEDGDEDAIKIFEAEKQRQLDKLNEEGRRGDLEQIAESLAYEELGKAQANKQLARPETDVTQSTNEIIGAYASAYVEALFELLNIDEIIEMFYSVPAVKLIVDLFKSLLSVPPKYFMSFSKRE